jgi:hypothetical protein
MFLSPLGVFSSTLTDIRLQSLWSSINIDPHSSLKNAQMRLGRSRSVPLDIQITLPDRITFVGNSLVAVELVNAFDLLKPHMARWRTLRIQVPDHAHARVAFDCCAGSSVPLLKEFSVQVGQSRSRDSEELPWLFDETPALRQLSLTSVHIGWDAARFRNLASLHLSDYWDDFAPSTQQLLDILEGCAATLTDLTLRNMSECDSNEEMQMLDDMRYVPRVKLPRLKQATFYFVGSSRLSILMSRLELPALEQLELSYVDDVSMSLEMLCQQKAENLPLKVCLSI